MTKIDRVSPLDRDNDQPQIPGPQGLSLVKSLYDCIRTPLEFSLKCARQYGDIVSLSIGSIRNYLLNDPSLIEEVLSKQNQNFTKDISYRILKKTFGNGLLLSDGELWKRHRKLMQSAFSSDRIASYASGIVEETSRMLSTWREEVIDIHYEMSQLTVKVITQSMFGVDGTETAKEITKALDTIMLQYFHQAEVFFFLPTWLPTIGNWKAHRATKRLNEIVCDIIEQRRQFPKDDLLSIMLRIEDENGNGLSDRELRDEVMTAEGGQPQAPPFQGGERLTLLLAGHDTTANALTWTLMLLAQNPEAEAKLVAEVRSVLQEGLPTINDLPKLQYTEMVLKESMRLYPPAWALGREVTHDCTIGNYHFTRGTTIIVSQWVMHRDERFFDNPEQFSPERWNDNLEQHLPRCAYFPFGAGPRVCIGKTFSMMEAMLTLAMVVQQFNFTLVQHSIELLPSITLRPKHGVKMMLTRREASPN